MSASFKLRIHASNLLLLEWLLIFCKDHWRDSTATVREEDMIKLVVEHEEIFRTTEFCSCLGSGCAFMNFKFLILSCKILEEVFGLPTIFPTTRPASHQNSPIRLDCFLSYKHTNQEFYAKVDTLVKGCGSITLHFWMLGMAMQMSPHFWLIIKKQYMVFLSMSSATICAHWRRWRCAVLVDIPVTCPTAIIVDA